jgi:hypothetical protein
MTSQMKDFLTVEEAVQLTRTSESTIRRFCRSLSEDQRRKAIRKEGKRLFISRSALQEAFDLLPGIEDGKSADVVAFQRQQLQESAKLTSRLTDQNERLLTELTKTSEDLKTAWSLIDHLKGEVSRLTADLKRLEAPGAGSSSKFDRFLYVGAIVFCIVAIVALLAFLR